MAAVPSQSIKIPVNVPTPRNGVELMEFLTKYQKADEIQLFLKVMGNPSLLDFTLAPGNEYVFNAFRALLGKTPETHHNRTLLDIAMERNAENRYEKVRTILCDLKPYQVAVLSLILRDLFNNHRILKNRAKVCGDAQALTYYNELIFGDSTAQGTSDMADAARKGQMGQWRIDHNLVSGQLLVSLGEIEEKELLDFIRQQDFERLAARKEMHGCPICHGIFPVDEMVQTAKKPYGMVVWICRADYNIELAKGENGVILGEPVAQGQPIPQQQPLQTINNVIDHEITGKLWKPILSIEKQVDIAQQIMSEKLGLQQVPTVEFEKALDKVVAANNAAVDAILERAQKIREQKHCTLQKAILQAKTEARAQIDKISLETTTTSGTLVTGIRKKQEGVKESPETAEPEPEDWNTVEWMKKIDDCKDGIDLGLIYERYIDHNTLIGSDYSVVLDYIRTRQTDISAGR